MVGRPASETRYCGIVYLRLGIIIIWYVWAETVGFERVRVRRVVDAEYWWLVEIGSKG